MIVERSTHPEWLSNSYLVAAAHGSSALIVDAGAPVAPLIAAAGQFDLRIEHVLLTHHHHDHVSECADLLARFGCEVGIHESERDLVPAATRSLRDGETLSIGGLDVEVLHVPGHTRGQLSFVVGGVLAFTGDTLFQGSVGGTRAPGHGTYQELRASIMDRLMRLPPETRIHAGHGAGTTVADEWESNPFVRAWRGLDREGAERCVALGEPARLIVWALDYDGGHKAWVRFDDGRDEIVPGSRVQR